MSRITKAQAAYREAERWQELLAAAVVPLVKRGRVEPYPRAWALRALMELHGLTAASVARDLGVTRPAVTNTLAGYRGMGSKRIAEHLSHLLGVPMDLMWGVRDVSEDSMADEAAVVNVRGSDVSRQRQDGRCKVA